MLALSGYPLGIDCTLLDTSPDAPGAQVAASVLGALDDVKALAELAAKVDVVTLEIENVAVAALESLHGRIDVFPPPAPAMSTSRPRPTAPPAYSYSKSGVRCAETTRTSKGISSAVSVSVACIIVDQSERDPMMTPTNGFIGALYSS